MNLVGNALKYHKPNVQPNIKLWSDEEGDEIKVYIEDNGVGISEEDLKIVSEPLFRGKSSEGTEGSGLGLSLAKNIVTEFKGKLKLHSEKDKGTKVELSFPKV